ncbi:MAG: hypothetical protein LBQ67_01290, partial [Treponema sp.]|nr:hypothetical protein [Treponema sp.]
MNRRRKGMTLLIKILLPLFCGLFFSCAATPPAPDDFELPGESAGIEDESSDGDDAIGGDDTGG